MTEGMCLIGSAAPESSTSFAAEGDHVVMAAGSQVVETAFDIQSRGFGLDVREDAHGQPFCCVGFYGDWNHGKADEAVIVAGKPGGTLGEGVLTPQTQALHGTVSLPRRELKTLMRRSDLPALVRLPLWYGLLASTALLVWTALDTWWLVPVMFVHGVVLVHHFSLQHECIHFTAFRTRRINEWVAAWCGFWICVPPVFFRYEHCDHHTHTQIVGRDPELIPLSGSVWGHLAYLSSLPYWRGMLGGLLRHAWGRLSAAERRFVPPEERRAVAVEARVFLALYLAVAAAMVVFDWWAPLWFWWLPVFLGEPVMRLIRMTEHVGRPNVRDMTINTRTTLVSWPWRFLAWNMPFHAEHHFAPSVPFHALPALHEKLKGHLHVEAGGYLGVHRGIVGQITGRTARLGDHVGTDAR